MWGGRQFYMPPDFFANPEINAEFILKSKKTTRYG